MENMIQLWILTSYQCGIHTIIFPVQVNWRLSRSSSFKWSTNSEVPSLQNEQKWGNLWGRYWRNLSFKESFLQNTDTRQEDAAYMGALTPHNFCPAISANDYNCLASFTRDLRWCFRGRETAASLVAHCYRLWWSGAWDTLDVTLGLGGDLLVTPLTHYVSSSRTHHCDHLFTKHVFRSKTNREAFFLN